MMIRNWLKTTQTYVKMFNTEKVCRYNLCPENNKVGHAFLSRTRKRIHKSGDGNNIYVIRITKEDLKFEFMGLLLFHLSYLYEMNFCN